MILKERQFNANLLSDNKQFCEEFNKTKWDF